MSIKRDYAWMLGSRTATMTVAIFTAGLINRAVGPFGRGFIAEIQTWVGLFIVIFGIGIDTAIYHFANRKLYGTDDKSRFVVAFYLTLICSLIAGLCLMSFVTFWPKPFSPKTVQYLMLIGLLLASQMFATNINVFFQALGKIKFSSIIGIVQSCVNVTIIGCGSIYGFIDIKFVVISLIATQVVAIFMILGVSIKSGYFSGRFSKDMARGMIKAGLKHHIGAISTFVYMKINLLILFRYYGESEAGLFAASLNLALALIFIPSTFQIVLYPRVIHSTDDYDITVRAMRLVFYGWGVAILLLMLFAKPIILIYGGSSFLPSVNIFRVLLVAAWLLPFNSLLAPYFVKAGAFMMASMSAVVLGVISMGLNIFLVPRYASKGAALATSFTTIIGFCIVIAFAWYLSKNNPLVIFKPNFKIEFDYLKKLSKMIFNLRVNPR